MEKKLRKLFDYQKFENDPALAKLIDDAEKQDRTVLCDDDLADVAAAGAPQQVERQDGNNQSQQGQPQTREPEL